MLNICIVEKEKSIILYRYIDIVVNELILCPVLVPIYFCFEEEEKKNTIQTIELWTKTEHVRFIDDGLYCDGNYKFKMIIFDRMYEHCLAQQWHQFYLCLQQTFSEEKNSKI